MAIALLAAACSSPVTPAPQTGTPTEPASGPATSASPTTRSATSASPTSPSEPAPPGPVRAVDGAAAMATVRALAAIGPRDAVSPAYRRAADLVARRFTALGYRVTRQPVPMPAGESWGVPVRAGTSVNVIADPPGFATDSPHVVLGAHLDTVPQSPGAEDNASGVAVLLELARVLAEDPAASGLPVRFVAFGGEESRGGSGPGTYAFGSRRLVASLSAGQRRAVVAMVSLDRVGVPSSRVPVCHATVARRGLADAIRTAARSAAVVTNGCTNRASDHVAFDAARIPAARIGNVPYPAYHSRRDVPAVLDPRQLERVGTVLVSWLGGIRPRLTG